MKKTTVFYLFMIAFAMTFTSCSKDDDGGPVGSAGNLTLKADGQDWSASLTVQAVNSNGVISVTGSDSNAKQCNITLVNISSTGTYTLGGSMTAENSGRWTAGLATTDTYSTFLGQGSGTCTITELTSGKVSGTFEFTAKNTSGVMVTISEGSFSANFSK